MSPKRRRRKTSPERTFTRRTANIYNAQKRRAARAGAGLDYTLDRLRTLARAALENPEGCWYCSGPMTEANLSADHAQPVSRGGSWSLSNVRVVCGRCNRAKGSLTWTEYMSLLSVVRCWPAETQDSFLRRLQAGAAIVRC